MALKRPQFPLSVPDTPDTSPVSESGPLPKINTSNVGPTLELPNELSQLHQHDLESLNHLCHIYNAGRNYVIFAEGQHQEMFEIHAHEIATAIEQLQQLRHDLTECFKLARQEIDARGDTFTGTVMYIPLHLRNR